MVQKDKREIITTDYTCAVCDKAVRVETNGVVTVVHPCTCKGKIRMVYRDDRGEHVVLI